MDVETVATLALIISAISLFFSGYAAWLSKQTHDQNKKIHDSTEQLSFEKQRTEILEHISDSRALLRKAYLRIGALKADFDAQPDPVKSLLVNYISLFTEYFPKIEDAIGLNEALKLDVEDWKFDIGRKELEQAKATLYDCKKTDEETLMISLNLADTFEAKMKEAIEIKNAHL